MAICALTGRRLRFVTLLLGAFAGGCRQTSAPRPAETGDRVGFIEAAHSSGLDFVHVNGMRGKRAVAEIMGPGVALFDYDNDGDLDVYVVQGGELEAGTGSGGASGDRLFRNDLTVAPDGTHRLHFTDITAQAGIHVHSYGMGVAAGDYDNDGRTDLLLTRFGSDVLLHNNPDGTFSDVTATAGIVNPNWSVAASFFDYDRDGWLDLYIGNYVIYSPNSDSPCFGPTGAPDYCSPSNYRSVPGRLYHNERNGSFRDVTLKAGLARDYGPALGSITADLNDDGWPDLFVANDGTDNQLWMNRHDGTFENEAVLAGVAVNGAGRAEGSMGVDAGDFDRDGDDDLLVTNLTGEGTTLYVNDGTGAFQDAAARVGLRSLTLPFTGFGAAWIDFDNDGWLDILTSNGAIQVIQALARAGDTFPLHQRKQLLRNDKGRFVDVTREAGPAFDLSEVGRGAAFGDIDNDGDLDAVVANNNGPVRLLVNQIGNRKHWLGVRATGTGGRDMLGATVRVTLPGGGQLVRRAHADGSYGSANDARTLFGLGDVTALDTVRVRWPSGRDERFRIGSVDRWMTVHEGSGQ